MNKITISVIKVDVGGYVGHSAMHAGLIRGASRLLEEAQKQNQVYMTLPQVMANLQERWEELPD